MENTTKEVTERIDTVDDVLADNGLTREQFDQQCAGLPDDEVAYRILKLMARSLNEGWTPDWDDSSQYKYFPYFEMGGSAGFRFRGFGHDGWDSDSGVGSRLCFKSSELAKYAGTRFIEVYRKFMTYAA